MLGEISGLVRDEGNSVQRYNTYFRRVQLFPKIERGLTYICVTKNVNSFGRMQHSAK